MDRIPVNVQRHIAGFATEAGEQVRSGGRFLGGDGASGRNRINACVVYVCVHAMYPVRNAHFSEMAM